MTDYLSEIEALISNGMGDKLHWFPEEVSEHQLAATLVGFANSGGGTVILGVSPKAGEMVGVRAPQVACERIFQAALLSDPTLVLPVPQQLQVQKTGMAEPVRLIVIHVPAGLPYVYSLDGRYFGRDGTKTSLLPPRRLHKLLNERSLVQFESQVVAEATLADLDRTAILEYAHTLGNIAPNYQEQAYEFLVKRGCLKRVEGELKPNYAALLLFGSQPQQWLPNATILAGRFSGLVLSDTYIKKDISGNLVEQLRHVEEFIQTTLKSVVRLVGFQHEEILEYPLEAVRELIVNAVAHRDYNLQGDNIHLNIFADRLEVTSPGLLPGPVTLENLLEARFARNAVISQVLSDLGYVERLGYGLDRVVEVTQKVGLPSPQFEEAGGTFKVTLFASPPEDLRVGRTPDLSVYKDLDLNQRQRLALIELAKSQRISSHQYQYLCPRVHTETLRRDLVDLVKRGLIIKIGDKKATYYILKRV